MHSPERLYQMAFDFKTSPESHSPIYRIEPNSLAEFGAREAELDRFVQVIHERPTVRTPSDAARFLQERVFTPFDAFEQEELHAIMLNTKSRITHEAMIYRGTIDCMYVRAAEIFRPAVRLNARSIILAHNHPSGQADASPEDVRVSTLCAEAGAMLGVECLDHLILGRESWISLKEKGLAFRV